MSLIFLTKLPLLIHYIYSVIPISSSRCCKENKKKWQKLQRTYLEWYLSIIEQRDNLLGRRNNQQHRSRLLSKVTREIRQRGMMIRLEYFVRCVLKKLMQGIDHTHFNKIGWINVIRKFHLRTGLNYDQKQLKNKWEKVKSEYCTWKNLVEKETGLGWNHDKNTIDAPNEWWAKQVMG